jgi:cob(I)alamin adenosyltransferase
MPGTSFIEYRIACYVTHTDNILNRIESLIYPVDIYIIIGNKGDKRMNKEDAIELNKTWIKGTEQSIKNYSEVIEALKNRVDMFKERIHRYESEMGKNDE